MYEILAAIGNHQLPRDLAVNNNKSIATLVSSDSTVSPGRGNPIPQATQQAQALETTT